MSAQSDRQKLVSDKIFRIERSLASDDIEPAIGHLKRGTGSRTGCLASLVSHAMDRGLLAWFKMHDLTALRQWFREVARLDRLSYEAEANTLNPLAASWALMYPLVANDEELIDWYSGFEGTHDGERVEDTDTADFLAYQYIVALRGDWARLASRCDRLDARPPAAARLQKYAADHQVFRSLARGDEAALQGAMTQLLDPQLVRSRTHDERGSTEGLVFTPAVIYAKLAWRRGMKIVPDTPLVPPEWLPLDPAPPMPSPYGI